MTTRAGIVGLGTGALLIAILFYPLYQVWPGVFVPGWPQGSHLAGLLLAALAAALQVAGGGLAAWWSGGVGRSQRTLLGALAGGVAALVLFCGLGAAAAGAAGASLSWADVASRHWGQAVSWTVWWTCGSFWVLMLSGMFLGAAGGFYAVPSPHAWLADDKQAPQMALNGTLTALPATAVAVLLTAGVFSPLAAMLQRSPGLGPWLPGSVRNWPVVTALLLYLLAHVALALVTPHEARQADHRCGLDEVKMAAWVGIFVPLALVALLLWLYPALTLSPPVLSCLLVSGALSVSLILLLRQVIFPRRAQMPPPADLVEAVFFGSIARSAGPRLVVLCIGCGIMMLAPVWVSPGAAALSLWLLSSSPLAPTAWVQQLYALQAALGLGLMTGAAAGLTAIYLFYLALGRWFHRAFSQRRPPKA